MWKNHRFLSMPLSFTQVLCLFVTVLQIRLKILAKLSDDVKSPLMKLHNSLNGKVCLMTRHGICAHRTGQISVQTPDVYTHLLLTACFH